MNLNKFIFVDLKERQPIFPFLSPCFMEHNEVIEDQGIVSERQS